MPYASEQFAYSDMIKTGSNWTSRAMLRQGRLARRLGDGQHQPAWWTRAHAGSGKVHFGTIRHPYSWYASWFRHAAYRAKVQDALARMGSGSRAWADVLSGSLSAGPHWPGNPLGFAHLRADGLPWKAGDSLWSYTTRYFYADPTEGRQWLVDALVPMEHLREGLSELGLDERLLGRKNEAIGEKVELTDEQREAIWKVDGPLARSLGYRKDGTCTQLVVPVLCGKVGDKADPLRMSELRRRLA